MESILLTINIILAVLLVIVVLLQRSEGGALGLGVSQDNFTSSRSASDFLTKFTSILAVFFIITSIALVSISRVEIKEIQSVIDLEKEKDPSFGNTRGSLYELFHDNDQHPIIKYLAEDLEQILMKTFNSNIFVDESFFSIFGAGGGTKIHNHISSRDKDPILNLARQKYSLVYYLSVGDQECSEPGILKLYGPDEDILPTKGLITVFPSDRNHSSVYGGNIDRVIIGVNFYCL